MNNFYENFRVKLKIKHICLVKNLFKEFEINRLALRKIFKWYKIGNLLAEVLLF